MGPPRQAATRKKTAAFVLREAVAHGVIIGTDGNELIMGPPRGMPRESWRSFQDALIAFMPEIIAQIEAENRYGQQG
jgi:hypothetical protein